MKRSAREQDVLTAREWEVLALVHEGLTNDQIATRLGISRDGAKYHVSEILSKLQLSDRIEAARWFERSRPRARRSLLGGILGGLGTKASSISIKVAAGALGTVAVVGIAALIAGILLMESRSRPQTPASDRRTGNEVLDGMIDDLLLGDATSLNTRFGDVAAREGAILGGPVGLVSPHEVTAAEWTSRLAGATKRRLHAVVNDPKEPYPWTQSNPPPTPRAAFYDGPRDFDIILVINDGSNTEYPWRFSVLDGRIVDVIIDSSAGQPPTLRSLALRLAQLTPPPETQPDAFVLLPPEEEWLPPISVRYTGRPPSYPSAPDTPSFAPDGRTGIAGLDAVINALLEDGASELAKRFPIAGREEVCVFQPQPGICSTDDVRAPVADWTRRLAEADRSLYAVVTSDPVDAEIFLAVDEGSGVASPWSFLVENSRLVEVSIRLNHQQTLPLGLLARYAPSPSREYERFYVLPPRDELPKSPPAHPLSARTGNAGVDSLLAMVEARSVDSLLAALETPARVPVRTCMEAEALRDAAYVESGLKEALARVSGVHAVVRLPQGYQPAATHLIILVEEINPFRWQAMGVIENQGKIAGLIDGECFPETMYPPAAYVVPPPPGGVAGLDASRRSAIPVVDAILDALQTQDEAKWRSLLVYSPTPCGSFDYAAPCPAGAPAGTLVDAISTSTCHGGYMLPEDYASGFGSLHLSQMATRAMYAVVPPPSQGTNQAAASAGLLILARPEGGAVALTVNQQGITSFRGSCGTWHPEWLIRGNQPAFLLPPP